jgi:hypothetical protein
MKNLGCVIAIIGIAVWVTIIYIVLHFLIKFW